MATYRVTGALAQVPYVDANGNPALIYLYEGSLLPPGVADDTIAHLLDVELIGEVVDGYAPMPEFEVAADDLGPADDPDGPGGVPARSASKGDWVAYAVTQGMSEDDANAATKDDLIAAYTTS